MASSRVSALLDALFIHEKAEVLDKATKAALRLCSKHFQNLVDGTVVEVEKSSGDLNLDLSALINSEWHGLKTLRMVESLECQNSLQELPSALFVKFSRLETLEIDYCTALKTLPEEIGALSHLKSLEIYRCYSLTDLPSSLGKLTTLEMIDLWACHELTNEGLAPLQHLTGLTFLKLAYFDKLHTYPEFICNLPLLKDLQLCSHSVQTLPAALGNLTNLESLKIELRKLKRLPESIGNLNALKVIDISWCFALTSVPESLDALLWRKAQETEESKMERVDFSGCTQLVLSSEMKHALELMKQNGVIVTILRFDPRRNYFYPP